MTASAALSLDVPFSLDRILLRSEASEPALESDRVEIRLADVPLQVQARVLSVSGLRPFRRRLMELGLVPGTEVKIVNVAPLGDPLELEVRHCRISIRKEESKLLSCSISRASLTRAFAV